MEAERDELLEALLDGLIQGAHVYEEDGYQIVDDCARSSWRYECRRFVKLGWMEKTGHRTYKVLPLAERKKT